MQTTLNLETQEDIDITRALISPPGDTLNEYLQWHGITQKELAVRMQRPEKTISEIINGKTAITVETAQALAHVLGAFSAEFWIARERNYQLELAELNRAEERIKNLEWLNHFPLEEMAANDWITNANHTQESLGEVMRFFCVAKRSAFESIYGELMHQTLVNTKVILDPTSLAVWLRQGEIEAGKAWPEVPYSERALKKVMAEVLPLVRQTEVMAQLSALLAAAGVALVAVPVLKKARVNACVRRFRGRPIIQLAQHVVHSERFWPVLLRMVAHIFLHSKKEIYLDYDNQSPTEQIAETQAWAEKYLPAAQEVFMQTRQKHTAY